MSASYLPAVKEYFPLAEQVIDKFHVKQTLTKALDEVRKNEQREVDDKKTLFQYRKLFLTRDDHMSQKQQDRYRTLSKTYPKTARAHRIVESLDTFYACTNLSDASKRFKELYSWMRRCRLEPMKNAALTLMNHRKEIMNYFHDRITNAICEGINSLVQAAKRKAGGFNTFDGFRAMIFLVSGNLKLDVPFSVLIGISIKMGVEP
jgi:transposase